MRRLSLLLTALVSASARHTEREPPLRPSSEWPQTVSAAVDTLLRHFSAADSAQLRDVKRADMFKYHFGFGTGIRNDFGLWRGNHSLLRSCGQPTDPEGCSGVILDSLWQRLHPGAAQ